MKARIADFFGITTLAAGGGLVAYGLVSMDWPEAISWSSGGLVRYILFICISVLFVGGVSKWGRISSYSSGMLFLLCIAVFANAIWPLMVVVWFAISSYLVGRKLIKFLRTDNTYHWWLSFLFGAGAYGSITSLLALTPVNYPWVYWAILAIPIILDRRLILDFLPSVFLHIQKKEADGTNKWLGISIVTATLIHFVVAFMPEVGHDALAMHLFIPAHLLSQNQWGFDPSTYVWALMPMLGDWLFAIVYMLGGETSARILNVAFIGLIAWTIKDIVVWAGGSENGGKWGALIFLSTPLTFLESSSLFIESIWASFVIAGVVILLKVSEGGGEKGGILTAAAMFGFAVASKAITLKILPIFVLMLVVRCKNWFHKEVLKYLLWGSFLFFLLGCIPYVTSWVISGNPVFPFFNAIFLSPYFPLENFNSATVFGSGFTWDTIYRITFDSGEYLESRDGVAGFQWLLLLVFSLVFIVYYRNHRGLWLFLLGSLMVIVIFHSVSYLRYVFPAWPILIAVIAVGISLVIEKSTLLKTAVITLSAVTVLLNALFLSSGAFYKDFPVKTLLGSEQLDTYFQKRIPVRSAVNIVNQLNKSRSPVAVFSSPYTAGLRSDALYASWYNYAFREAITKVDSEVTMAEALKSWGVEYVIYDANWQKLNNIGLMLSITDEIATIGSVSVRKMARSHMYSRELLVNTGFDDTKGWVIPEGAVYLEGTVKVRSSSAVKQLVSVEGGGKYLNTVVARCDEMPAQGRMQINWKNPQGKFISADSKVFNCESDWKEYSAEFVAPDSATVGVVYTTSHNNEPVIFTKNSFRY